MSVLLYEIAGAGDLRFSPFCWRAKLALAHKGIDYEAVPVKYTEKEKIAFSGQGRVPVLVDGEHTVSDSWTIACHLEDAYPDRPSLFGGPAGRGAARFVNFWTDGQVGPALLRLIVADIHARLQEDDKPYFRESREQRFGMSLEQLVAGREDRVGEFRERLAPLRATVEAQPFLCGDAPAYGDYIVFGTFQFARMTSSFELLDAEDPIHAWRERMTGMFVDDGAARTREGA